MMNKKVKFRWMVVLTILHTLEKESGEKALWLRSYFSLKFFLALLRTLQNGIWGIKRPRTGPKNGGGAKLVHKAIERFASFSKM